MIRPNDPGPDTPSGPDPMSNDSGSSRQENSERSSPGPLPPGAEARAAYYEARFGKPRMFWQENEVESPAVHVVAYPPSESGDRDCYTILTTGMSDARMRLPDDVDPALARAELLLYALPSDTEIQPPHVPWFVSVLHALSHMPWRFGTWLGESHTIPNGDPPAPFVEGSHLTTALLLPPLFEPTDFATGFALEGEPVIFYWLAFITTSECEFKIKNGYEALMRKFEEANFPHIVDPGRKPVV